MNNIKSIFISRKLNQDSLFWQLESKGIKIIHESLIDFTFNEYAINENVDWIFFYSKNGIKSFYKQHKLASDIKVAVMGIPSNAYLKTCFGREADFIFDESSNNFDAFNLATANQHILFIEASHSKKRFQIELNQAQIIQSIVAYTNTPKISIDIGPTDLLIFTSPLNAKIYLNQYPDRSKNKMIAIGPSTQDLIKSLTGQTAIIPNHSHENDLYGLVLDMLNF